MDLETRLRFERHIAICPPRRGFLSQMRTTVRASREISEEALSPEVREGLLEAFRDWRG
jgi:hypothetical protein